jgi:response regulator RpfG family c-di-GMP phosphodiesterase
MARESIADRLLAAKLITPEHHAAAGYRARTGGTPAEDFLIELGAIREEDLLKFIAEALGTQYLSTEKLRSANLPRSLLDMVPLKVIEATGMAPIRWDPHARILAVITADPENLDALGQIRAAAGVRDVQAVLARPATVRAAIAKWYRNDPRPFQALGEGMRLAAEDIMGSEAMPTGEWLETTGSGTQGKPGQQWSIREPAREGGAPALAPGAKPGGPAVPAQPQPAAAEPAAIAVPGADYLETLNVLVSLLENSRAELRGHSAVTARHARELGSRLGLCPADLHAVTIAAFLHDLGKGSPFHLTALNVAEWEGHRDAAQKRFETPNRLLEAVSLRPEAARAIFHMYERVDGQGFPTGLRGKDIPIGARILAIVDTFADLTQNQRNPFRRTLGANEAVGVLDQYRGKIFDGDLVDLFRLVAVGSDLRQRLLVGFRPILVVDGEPEQSAALELRLLGRGFDVKAARTADAALRQLEDAELHMVVSEVDLEPFDGFELLRRARQADKSRAVPFLFLTSRAAAEDVARAFELGADDYVIKPSTTEVLVAKIRQILERRAGAVATAGVSGSLADMSLPDLVQILAQGRKTGKLVIQGAGGRGGEIHFLDGRVANALCQGRQGHEAFYALLAILEGTFALDPEFKPTATTIDESAEALLLEGMRRLDEAGR